MYWFSTSEALPTTDFGVSLKIRWESGQAELIQHCLSIVFTRHLISMIERKNTFLRKLQDIWWFIWENIIEITFKGKVMKRHWTNCHYSSSVGSVLKKLRTGSCIKNKEEVNDKSQTYLKHMIRIRNFLSFGIQEFGPHQPKHSLYKERECHGDTASQPINVKYNPDCSHHQLSHCPSCAWVLSHGPTSLWHLYTCSAHMRNSGGSAE